MKVTLLVLIMKEKKRLKLPTRRVGGFDLDLLKPP